MANGGPFTLSGGELELNLNGFSIDASGVSGNNPLFRNTGGTLTIADDVGTGTIAAAKSGTCLSLTGGTTNILGGSFLGASQCVNATGGTLNISDGNFTKANQCLDVSNSNVTITGGTFVTNGNEQNDIALMMSGNNTKVFIQGGNFESHYVTIWVRDVVKTNSELNITDGNFTVTVESATGFGYACGVDGVCDINISGGSFLLNAPAGSGLVLGASVTDDMVNISGGYFNGRIARAVPDASVQNHTAFYGDNKGNGGILQKGSVLTDNSFYGQGNTMVFTQENVQVVPGSLVKFDTRRSMIESYGIDESVVQNTADFYSIAPISVGAKGNLYTNTLSYADPSVETSRITDGNTYTFSKWHDANGTEYASVNDFIAQNGNVAGGISTLYAGWKAETGTEAGFRNAMKNDIAVDEIQVLQDFALTDSIVEENVTMERSLDLGGHTISYASSNASGTSSGIVAPALTLVNNWKIRNGSITSVNQPCFLIDGTAIVENLDCLAEKAPYVVGFENVSSVSKNQILSGTFETTSGTGYALRTSNVSGTGAATDITSLLAGPYVSSNVTMIDGANTYLNAAKLLVSESPITYIGNGADVSFGSHIYGDNISASSQLISNRDYVGDITITGVTVDNPVFVVTGENESKHILGGSTDTYSYTVGVAENADVGTHTGTATVKYNKMDGSEGAYTQKLSVTITPKQLIMTEPGITREKVYDGNATAQVTAGVLNGVVAGDDVTVTATATYDSADAGTGKKISVTYTLSGNDKGNYQTPAAVEVADGVIQKAAGSGSVVMSDYHVGETAELPVTASLTNGISHVTCYYKQKDAADDTYTTTVPQEEGSYTVKAVFAETANYLAVETKSDFRISYIETPATPYTLSGTAGNNGWYTSQVVIHPAEGYQISTDVNGTFGSSITVTSTDAPVVYLKDANGAVTKSIQVKKIWIDDKAPVITGVEDGVNYHDGNRTAQITDENLKNVTLNGVNILFTGTTASILAKSSTKEYVLVAEDDAGNKVTYKFHVEKSISTGGVSKLTKGESYKLGSGSWKVKGDSTVYNGNISFYVPSDGEYEFQKQ